MDLAGRTYPRVYRVQDRRDIHDFLQQAVVASGGHVLYASDAAQAPVFLGVRTASGERLGLLVYPFRMKKVPTRNRPKDEVRVQLRYGGSISWHAVEHPIGRDIAGVDTTLLLAVDVEQKVIVGLDPALYTPLPLGISMYARENHVAQAASNTWHVWEHVNKPGKRRNSPRSDGGLETLVAFTPERLLDYARFERTATDLGLDAPLRFSTAQDAATAPAPTAASHPLEADFDLAAAEILAIIAERNRLQVAVRGGVAEHHLERLLGADRQVADVERLDQDALHDFDVTMTSGAVVRVECKNASPEPYANGDYKVEVQKTRASKNDPASRFYRTDQFDVVAACLYSPTRAWTFRYAATAGLARHASFPEHLAPMQRIDSTWADSLASALQQ